MLAMSNWDLLNLQMTYKTNNNNNDLFKNSSIIVQKFEENQLQDVKGFKKISDARQQLDEWNTEMSKSLVLWLFYCKMNKDDESEDDSYLEEQKRLVKTNIWMTGVPANCLSSKNLRPLVQVCGNQLVYLDKPNVARSTEFITLKELAQGSWLSKIGSKQVYFPAFIAGHVEFGNLPLTQASFYAQDGHRFSRQVQGIAHLAHVYANFYNQVICSDSGVTSKDLLYLYSSLSQDEKDGFYCSFMNVDIK